MMWVKSEETVAQIRGKEFNSPCFFLHSRRTTLDWITFFSYDKELNLSQSKGLGGPCILAEMSIEVLPVVLYIQVTQSSEVYRELSHKGQINSQ